MNAPQGSEAWLLARCGRATASEFASVLAKGEGKTRRAYMLRLVGERLTGKPAETYSGKHTDRGQEQEPYARMAYEAARGVFVEESEFIPHPTLMAGCSPDGLIDDDGGVECKSVIPTVQIATIERGTYPPEHRAQIMGNLWVTRRAWWDFASYCADIRAEHLRLYVFQVKRDEEYIANLEKEVRMFLKETDELYARLMGRAPLAQAMGEIGTQA